MMRNVSLTTDELWQAVVVGANRRISCLFGRNKAQHYDSPKADEWATEIESCCAEIAVAKYLDRYWSGGVFDGARAEFDVGDKQVRHTPYATGCLIVYPEDKPDSRIILVTGKAPHYILRGWVLAKEVMAKGRDHEWWTQPIDKRCPSWWVPQSSLRQMPNNSSINTHDDPIQKFGF